MPSYGGFRRTSTAAAEESTAAGQVLLETVSDWSSLPAGWRVLHGDWDEDARTSGQDSAPTHSFASGGLTLSCKKARSSGKDNVWAPVGVAFQHTANAYTAVATFDTFTIGGATSTDQWFVGLSQCNGLVPYSATGDSRMYYDPDGTGGNKWQLWKAFRSPGDSANSWGTGTYVTDTTPTSLKLTLQYDELKGFKCSYQIDTGSGYGSDTAFVNGDALEVDGWLPLRSGKGNGSIYTDGGLGPKAFVISVGSNNGDFASAVSCRLTDLTVTGAA